MPGLIRFELITLITYYLLLTFSLTNILVGKSFLGAAGMTVIVVVNYLGQLPVRGTWDTFYSPLVLVRKIYWQRCSKRTKELHFVNLVVYCVMGDYPRFLRAYMDEHNLTETELLQIIFNFYSTHMQLLHPNWEKIAKESFISYGEAPQVHVAKIEELNPEMISIFKNNLESTPIAMVIDNYMFYQFFKNFPCKG